MQKWLSQFTDKEIEAQWLCASVCVVMCLDQVCTADTWQGKNVKVCLTPRPGHSLPHNAEWMRKFLISLFFILEVAGKLFEVLVEVAAGLWTIQGGCFLLFNEAPVFYSQSIFTSFSDLLSLEDSISSSYLVIYKSHHFCFCVCVAGGWGERSLLGEKKGKESHCLSGTVKSLRSGVL